MFRHRLKVAVGVGAVLVASMVASPFAAAAGPHGAAAGSHSARVGSSRDVLGSLTASNSRQRSQDAGAWQQDAGSAVAPLGQPERITVGKRSTIRNS